MNLSKYKPQNVLLLKKNQPDLYDTIRQTVPKLTDEQFGKVAGLIIEYVIQSGGNVEIFQSDDMDFSEDF
jgi:hypothetical protein